jgi:hypothetical protein
MIADFTALPGSLWLVSKDVPREVVGEKGTLLL